MPDLDEPPRCAHCTAIKRIHAKGRCFTCYQHLRRNGTDRPIDLLAREAAAIIDEGINPALLLATRAGRARLLRAHQQRVRA